VPEMDAGPIVLQDSIAVHANDTEETLAARVLELEHQIYPRALRAVALEHDPEKWKAASREDHAPPKS
jgi:folate-dependent phosphoribosylglycinamide formyltransferase PurN